LSLRLSRALGAAALAASGVLVASLAAPAGAATSPALAPLTGPSAASAAPGRYIVVLTGEPGSSSATLKSTVARAKQLGADVTHEYDHVLNGFSAALSDDELAAVRALPGVAYVARDTVGARPPTVQSPSPNWGLDRIDQHPLPLDGSYSYGNAAPGVIAYLLDTGIRATHQEYAGRVLQGYNVITAFGQPSNDTSDCYGHGTAMAGIFAGTTYGVAKQAQMIPVRVYGCDGQYWTGADWIAGINWITADHAAHPERKLALGEIQAGGPDSAIDAAIQDSIDAGVVWVSAAGNSGLDSCTVAIADVAANIVVSNVDRTDHPLGSNYGACVDVFAPGGDIMTSSYLSDTATTSVWGTSPAAPHALGVAAQYLYTYPNATPAQVQAAIVNGATTGVLQGLDAASPNRLLYNQLPAPQANPTFAVQAANLAPGAPTDNSIQADLRVRATGTLPIDLSKVTLRYWFSRDGGANTFNANCDYAAIGCAKVTQSVVNLATPRTGADAYLQVGFTSSAGSISGTTSTGQIQLRVNKTDWSNFSEAADYSYRNTATAADFTKVTGYYNGTLIWGTEP
jgi:hypothetical protein